MELNKIYNEDCLEFMKKIPENSIDAIVTDPPYGLEFMGKDWDKFKQGKNIAGGTTGKDTPFGRSKPLNSVYQYTNKQKHEMQDFFERWAIECLRVLKPGGFLLAFGGTRTYHRMACGIEDAGFEIRDCIQWLYGSGFPKSLNIGKQVDKMGGNKVVEFKKFRDWLKDKKIKSKYTNKQLDEFLGFSLKGGGMFDHFINDSQPQIPTKEYWFKIKEKLNLTDEWDYLIDREEAEREITGKDGRGELKEDMFFTQDNKKAFESGKSIGYGKWDLKDKPATEEVKQWEGWGTALKPANEPIVVARKPLSEKNVALNVLKWGTAGINIDACRIKGQTPIRRADKKKFVPTIDHQWGTITKRTEYNNTQGRFPANIILDEEAGRMLDVQTEGKVGNGHWSKTKTTGFGEFGNGKSEYYGVGVKDKEKGGASRFFYCPKASKSERNMGCEDLEEKKQDLSRKEGNPGRDNPRNRGVHLRKNNHPTVKPIKLMEYLIKLVSKEGATILDPFMGSGTTAISCVKLNRNFIGIEKEQNYIEIANARLKPYLEQGKLL